MVVFSKMKINNVSKLYHLLMVFVLLGMISCSTDNKFESKMFYILKTPINTINYFSNELLLSGSYAYYDDKNNRISKKRFIKELTHGKHLPLNISTNKHKKYKLFYFDQKIYEESSKIIMNYSRIELNNLLMIGKKLPEFNFRDLDGNIYNNQLTKDKVFILKIWFIGCLQCVKEIPDMNEYLLLNPKSTFKVVGLVLDDKKKISNFVKKNRVDFPTIPNAQFFINDQLKIKVFPTYIIVRNNKIEKVYNSFAELKEYLY